MENEKKNIAINFVNDLYHIYNDNKRKVKENAAKTPL